MTDDTKIDLSGKKVLISVPTYDGNIPVEWMFAFMNTITTAAKYGIDVGIQTRSNCSLIPQARDEIVHDFLFGTDHDYLLCIDADVIWNPDDVIQMIIDVDNTGGIVFGAYQAKTEKLNFHCDLLKLENKPVVSGHLLRALAGPAGFMMLGRELLMGMREKYPELMYKTQTDFPFDEKNVCSMFSPGVADNKYRGEDIAFCMRARTAGYRLWVNPDIHLIHRGNRDFKYPYKDFLTQIVLETN